MGDIYMLDYIQMLFLKAGYFQSEEAAMQWVADNDPDRERFYKPIRIGAAQPDGLTGIEYRYRYAYQS